MRGMSNRCWNRGSVVSDRRSGTTVVVKTPQKRKKQVCVPNGQRRHLLPILSRSKMWKCLGMRAMQVFDWLIISLVTRESGRELY